METAAERRRRILLANPQASPTDYDDALRLGYEPESYVGMWKLRAHRPIIWLTRHWALCAEVIGMTRKGRQRIHYALRRAMY